MLDRLERAERVLDRWHSSTSGLVGSVVGTTPDGEPIISAYAPLSWWEQMVSIEAVEWAARDAIESANSRDDGFLAARFLVPAILSRLQAGEPR